MIIQTRLLWFADGLTVNQSLIIINPRYHGWVALLEHEKTHQKQMARIGTWTFWYRYLTDKQFRMASEVEAYKVSIANGDSIAGSAEHLSRMYYLGISVQDAYKLLTT